MKSSESKDTAVDLMSSDSNTDGIKSQLITIADEPIDSWIPDENVQTSVTKTLGIAVSQLTKNKVSEIGTKQAFNHLNIIGAASLKGLEYATGGTSFAINAINMIIIHRYLI
ncbi:hypothetical protein IAE51_00015 [Lactococcus sp. S64]|uniref:hypothetical protein n=1 Tax=Lactococcus sp. S64 TaxID=2767459 RepID=UPI001907B1D2|nr:hypothetical protein [Lactococcus sp. S64]MBK0082310.1 hypothetical protein [Lactococcus sp. S64]